MTEFWRSDRKAPGRVLAALLLGALAAPGFAAGTQPLATIAAAASGAAEARARSAGFDALEVSVQPLDQRLRLPVCGEALVTAVTGNSPPLGGMSIRVRCPAPSPWSLYVQTTVRAAVTLPVLTRAIARGERIGRSDLELVERVVGSSPGQLLLDPARIVGLEARRDLPAGSTLQHGLLAAPVLVKRGQAVTLVASGDGLEVRMQGKALDRGAAGDRLRVTNLSSGRAVEGVVAEDGTVRIP